MKSNNWRVQLLVWRIKYLSSRNFLILLSALIGCFAGVASVILKEAVHLVETLLTQGSDDNYANYYFLAYPLLGLLITTLLAKYVFREPFGHGVTDILYAISKKSSNISRRKSYSNLLGSAITVGFGGSVGLEAPIVVTGSAIASTVGRLVHLQAKKRALLIGCGSAGAISAIFNSPIAGVIFSIEVILTEVNINAFIPLLIASVAGSLTSMLLYHDEILFRFILSDPFIASDTPYFIILGIICGLVSLYFTRVTYSIEEYMQSIRRDLPRALLGGIALGVVIFVFPPMYGEGYNFIKVLLQGKEANILHNSLFFYKIDTPIFIPVFMFGLILMKPIASALTLGSGGNGGIFGPSLFLGGVTGFWVGRVINGAEFMGGVSLSNFTLVGMCGVMSGVLHAPLTAIFLIAEITGGYTLFVPLMLVSAISYSTIYYFERYSLYTKGLIKRGLLVTSDRDQLVLEQLEMEKLVEKDLLTIHPDATLGDLVNLVQISRRNIFPVINQQKELIGIITLDDIREIMFDNEAQKNVIVGTLSHAPPDIVSQQDTMQVVMDKFEKTGAWNLPVLRDGKYAGLISKSRIFNAYRRRLIRHRPEY
uniref:Chloride channel protein n=1 Tax=Roseihalotalea indica TaxID=2867963 RepID=A0AA49JFY7_9BACT|nr:chloride channel protein [Tunicatimonas sp. TK19036]